MLECFVHLRHYLHIHLHGPLLGSAEKKESCVNLYLLCMIVIPSFWIHNPCVCTCNLTVQTSPKMLHN